MAKIKLNNNEYPIPDSALAPATADFVAHLGTIAGSGLKVVVGGVEYGIDSNKVQGAISALSTAFGELGESTPIVDEEILEGDGSEYYTLAPTPLSFRSTAPLNELQEVQINGVTVDPANYTLEEGSTIVTFPIEYLKTLATGDYEVSVVSTNKAVNGNFTVKTPELNEYGFYYNQPYTAFVSMFGENESVFIRNDGTMDIIGTPSGQISAATYSVNGNTITVISPIVGTLTGTISVDGIFINELATNFVLGDTSIAADEDYIYIYKEDLGGYEVAAIDKTKAEYGAIKTGINGIDTVALTEGIFNQATKITNIPKMPNTITSISQNAFTRCSCLTNIEIPDSIIYIGDEAFYGCNNLTSIILPNSVTIIGSYAFRNCHKLTNIEIPDSVTSIGRATFDGCSSLTSAKIGSGVVEIGLYAFKNCSALNEIRFNAIAMSNLQTHTEIFPEAINGSGEVPELKFIIGKDVQTIPAHLCRQSRITSVIFEEPSSCNSIGNSAFMNCWHITDIEIPDSVTSISEGAFFSCGGLISMTVPKNITNIFKGMFNMCGFREIKIHANVTSIGSHAMYFCDNLESIIYEGTIEQWNNIAFADDWDEETGNYTIHCVDGDIAKDGTITPKE